MASTLIDQLRNGHCAAILGQDSGLSGRMEELLQELTFTGDMEIEQKRSSASTVTK